MRTGGNSVKRKSYTKKTILSTVAYLVTAVFFFPLLWLVVTSLKSENDAVTLPPKIVFHPIFTHFVNALNSQNGAGFAHSFVNSVIAAVGGALIAILLGVPAAFALTAFPAKSDGNILFWFLSTKMMPMAGIIMPLYVITKSLHLLDNIFVVTIIYAAMDVPLVLWLLYSFFKEIPGDVWEAAQLDGVGTLRMLWSLAIPLMRTGISSSFLILLVLNWNEFFVAVNMTYTHATTLPILISGYMSSEGLFWAQMSAVGVMAVLPILVVGWFVHKQFVRGLTFGAVKG
jgi:sorbitol/mannitol transport system permease protein